MDKNLAPAALTASVGALAALLGLFVGKSLDRRHEFRRWLRDNRLTAAVAVLRSLDAVRDYASRMTLPNERRTAEEKKADKYLFGEQRRRILDELVAFRLIGTLPQRDCADRISIFVGGEIEDWMEESCRAAERGSVASPTASPIAKLDELTQEFTQATKDSLREARAQ